MAIAAKAMPAAYGWTHAHVKRTRQWTSAARCIEIMSFQYGGRSAAGEWRVEPTHQEPRHNPPAAPLPLGTPAAPALRCAFARRYGKNPGAAERN